MAKTIEVPLTLTRQTAMTAEKPLPGATFQPATAPVSAEQMQQVLAADLKGAWKTESGSLDRRGVSIGVIPTGPAG